MARVRTGTAGAEAARGSPPASGTYVGALNDTLRPTAIWAIAVTT
jgi:hypothetical protein